MGRKRNNSACGAQWWSGAVGSALLSALIILSALLMAAAVGSRSQGWLAWIGLLPLFLAIRVSSVHVAAAYGLLWGTVLHVFLSAFSPSALPCGVASWLLLPCVTGVYAGGSAWLTRRIGFSPFVLGVGWIGVELASTPLGLRYGLLAGAQGDGALLDVVGKLLGYVFVAFLMASVNASLLVVLSHARLSISRQRSSAGLPGTGGCCPSQTFLWIQLFALHQSYPRAPPIQGAAMNM
ncbi:MAG: hypothetical protein KAV82_06400 [Phycisphaerae bacterium]|nr:hypothetical protein [Phycisphaerae bacterium]